MLADSTTGCRGAWYKGKSWPETSTNGVWSCNKVMPLSPPKFASLSESRHRGLFSLFCHGFARPGSCRSAATRAKLASQGVWITRGPGRDSTRVGFEPPVAIDRCALEAATVQCSVPHHVGREYFRTSSWSYSLWRQLCHFCMPCS